MLLQGTPTVFMQAWNADIAADLVAEFAVGASSGAPVHLAALLDSAQARGVDLSSFTDYLLGAATVPPHLVARADAAGIRAFRAYGSSEHPTISSGRSSDSAFKRVNTDGRLTPGNEIRLIDDDDQDAPPGSAGEIVVRGPEQFIGYLDPALDADAYTVDGWLRTGDIGTLDSEGFLTITDRKKDIIIRGGEKISSTEIEDVLGTHPAVQQVAAVGVPDDRYGERVGVVVVLTPSTSSLELADVAAHFAAAGVAIQKTPERIMIMADLPRTAAGKVQKFALRAAWASESVETTHREPSR